MTISRTTLAILAAAALALSACSKDNPSGGGGAPAGGSTGSGAIGVDFPRADSDFWNAYNSYVPSKADELDVQLAGSPTNSQNDIQS